MEGQKPERGGSQGRIARHERSAQRALILDGSPSGGYGGQNHLQKGDPASPWARHFFVPLLSIRLSYTLHTLRTRVGGSLGGHEPRIVQLLGIAGLVSGSLYGLLVLRGLTLRHVDDA